MTRSLEELDRAVRRIEDRTEIAELISRFAIATDERDYETLRELLADDVRWEVGTGSALVGRDAVVDYLRDRLHLMSLTIHTPHAPVVTFVGEDEAEAVVPAQTVASTRGVTMALAARYGDRYVRCDDSRWRLSRRHMALFYGLPIDELGDMHEDLRVRWPDTDPAMAALPGSFPNYQRDIGDGSQGR